MQELIDQWLLTVVCGGNAQNTSTFYLICLFHVIRKIQFGNIALLWHVKGSGSWTSIGNFKCLWHIPVYQVAVHKSGPAFLQSWRWGKSFTQSVQKKPLGIATLSMASFSKPTNPGQESLGTQVADISSLLESHSGLVLTHSKHVSHHKCGWWLSPATDTSFIPSSGCLYVISGL